MSYYAMETQDVLNELNATKDGLSTDEALNRQQRYGKNVLEEKKGRSLLARIWDQIKDPMVMILIVAAIISGALGEIADTTIIIAVVLINAIIGLTQESKAEKAIEALKKMSAQQAKVIRDGKIVILDTAELVPGDIVSLEAGDLIPADIRLIKSSNLKIEEAALTGESVPSEKNAQTLAAEECTVGDRLNMAFFGTSVTYGHASGVVCYTGMSTQMGEIANMINQSEDNQTPLQLKLEEIGKMLTVLVVGICTVIFITYLLKNGGFIFENILNSFMLAVSLAVAAIPEGLPAVVTIVMAVGVTRMAKRRAIIKKLPAVETLGCAEIICSDKTGTLTQNKMDVRELYLDETFYSSDEFLSSVENELIYDVLYLCNDSVINDDSGEVGDPTETCLKRFTLKKYMKSSFSHKIRITDLPFDSQRKMMSTVNDIGGHHVVLTKGAPDELLKRCTRALINGKETLLTPEIRDKIMKANSMMAGKALRVLGCAFKPYDENTELESELIFIGLVGMIDPPRPEVFEAINKCRRAGITPIMITGDHKDTAVAIAREIGIIQDERQAIFGSELDSMTDSQLDDILDNIRVYARVSPEHKVRIVEAWRRRGKVVAMTGDGVNDAPALKTADIGVGMGITGTDVTKGVADMLLSDDNFATIVNAVEEGRIIYRNVRKAVQFLLSSNISEVLSLFIATLVMPAGVPFLGAVHILWINLVTDTFPAIGLGMDKAEPGIMDEPPRDSRKSFFSGGLTANIIYQGLVLSAITLISYFTGEHGTNAEGTTMAFITLSTVQLFHSYNMRTDKVSIFTRNIFDNPIMLAGAVIPMLLMVAIVNIPVIGTWFRVVPLSLNEWIVAIGLSASVIPIVEIVKFFQRRFEKRLDN